MRVEHGIDERLRGMKERSSGTGAQLRARAAIAERGQANVATGLPVLDHLLTLLAEYASLDLALEVEPGAAGAEVAAAGRALGEALYEPLHGEGVRGHGTARVLIEAVADAARKRGASRFYWQTKHDNAIARALYDKVARFRGFIRYDYPME